jgi:hypothetical protein
MTTRVVFERNNFQIIALVPTPAELELRVVVVGCLLGVYEGSLDAAALRAQCPMLDVAPQLLPEFLTGGNYDLDKKDDTPYVSFQLKVGRQQFELVVTLTKRAKLAKPKRSAGKIGRLTRELDDARSRTAELARQRDAVRVVNLRVLEELDAARRALSEAPAPTMLRDATEFEQQEANRKALAELAADLRQARRAVSEGHEVVVALQEQNELLVKQLAELARQRDDAREEANAQCPVRKSQRLGMSEVIDVGPPDAIEPYNDAWARLIKLGVPAAGVAGALACPALLTMTDDMSCM